MAVPIAVRPVELSGALQTWTETTQSAVVRSQMESGTVKVRRRTTGIVRTGDASVTLKAEQYRYFAEWFEIACQAGVMPTRFRFPPDCTEEVWRFASPPVFDWSIDAGAKAVRVSFQLEQMPDWRGL